MKRTANKLCHCEEQGGWRVAATKQPRRLHGYEFASRGTGYPQPARNDRAGFYFFVAGAKHGLDKRSQMGR